MYTLEEAEKIVKEYNQSSNNKDPEIPLCTGLNGDVKYLEAKAFIKGFELGKQFGKCEALKQTLVDFHKIDIELRQK